MWHLLPFLSLAPLPPHLQQQCKQLSSRTFELLSQSSSPSLWRSRGQDVSAHTELQNTKCKYDSEPPGDRTPLKHHFLQNSAECKHFDYRKKMR